MDRGVWWATVRKKWNMTEQLSPYKFLLSEFVGPYTATSLVPYFL